jgi:urea transporter
MFQNNIYSGALFLVGIFYNSWLLGLAALLGTIISTGAAHLLKYSKEDIQNGLYGFNGTLTGIAVFCFFEVNVISIAAWIIGSVLSTIIMQLVKKFIPPFTAPFVFSTWIIIYSLILVFNLSLLPSTVNIENSFDVVKSLSNNFGQVMFQENVITGLFFLVGILVNNRLMAAYALYAAVLSTLIGWLLSEPIHSINAGIMGYNGILCALALTGRKWKDFIWITVAVFLSILVNIKMAEVGLITLTAPFVFVTWLVWGLKQVKPINKRELSI